MPLRANSANTGGVGGGGVTTRASEVRYGDRKFQRLVTDIYPRCWRCDHKFGDELTRPWKRLKCPKCNAMNNSQPIVD